MTKVKYIKDETKTCVLVCPYIDNGLRIGSIGCQSCIHNNETNIKEEWVDCEMEFKRQLSSLEL